MICYDTLQSQESWDSELAYHGQKCQGSISGKGAEVWVFCQRYRNQKVAGAYLGFCQVVHRQNHKSAR